MPRRVWIVKRKKRLGLADFNDAQLNGCPEIANGIPPALQGIVSESNLPCIYEEPEPPVVKTDWKELYETASTVGDKCDVIARRLGLKE